MPDNAWPLVALYCLVSCVRDAPIRRGAHEGANRASRSLIPPRGPRVSRLYVPLAPHLCRDRRRTCGVHWQCPPHAVRDITQQSGGLAEKCR